MIKNMINYLFLLFGALFVAYYLVMGFAVRFGQSMLWVWLVAGVALIARFVIVRGAFLDFPKWLVISVNCACAAGLAFFLIVEGFVATGLFEKPAENADYVIILGAKVESKGLDNRIDAAAEYLRDNPDAIAIASGGQGSDEPITEALYIKQRLVDGGISEDRILLEDRSTSTIENFTYSMELVDVEDPSIVVVTHDFHMFRSLRIAKRCGASDVSGLPVRSSRLSFPHYMLREFFTTVVDTLRGNT